MFSLHHCIVRLQSQIYTTSSEATVPHFMECNHTTNLHACIHVHICVCNQNSGQVVAWQYTLYSKTQTSSKTVVALATVNPHPTGMYSMCCESYPFSKVVLPLPLGGSPRATILNPHPHHPQVCAVGLTLLQGSPQGQLCPCHFGRDM